MTGSTSARGFDRLAWVYRPMEYLLAGRVMQAARTVHLPSLDSPAKILIIGEGPGRLLEVLVARFPTAEVTVLEQSKPMIAIAQGRLKKRPEALARVTFVTSDLFTATFPAGQYDTVFTPFILDCFTLRQVESAVARIASHTGTEAHWIHTDFQVPASGWRHWRARAIHRLMYLFFRYATRLPASEVHPPDESLRAQGFALSNRRTFSGDLIRADHWRRTA